VGPIAIFIKAVVTIIELAIEWMLIIIRALEGGQLSHSFSLKAHLLFQLST
jgi:hypothetical protein